MRVRILIKAAFILFFVSLNGPILAAQTLVGGQTPGTYTSFILPSEVKDITFPIKIEVDPGVSSDTFWSNQFAFDNNHTAYIGMQRDGGNKSIFLWSVWGVSDYRQDGSLGSWCQRHTEDQGGISCRISYPWAANHTYLFHVFPSSPQGWYSASIDDIDGQGNKITTLNLGSIKIGASGISSETIGWVEYFEWNNNRTVCRDNPYSQALFYYPYGHDAHGNKIHAKISGHSLSGTCQSMAKSSTVGDGGLERLAIGNSTRHQIHLKDNKTLCIDSNGGLIENTSIQLYHCKKNTDDLNQALTYSADDTLHFTYDYCLAVLPNHQVIVRTCQSAPEFKWELDPDGHIINEKYHLSINGYTSSPLYLSKTANVSNQLFDTTALRKRYKLAGD